MSQDPLALHAIWSRQPAPKQRHLSPARSLHEDSPFHAADSPRSSISSLTTTTPPSTFSGSPAAHPPLNLPAPQQQQRALAATTGSSSSSSSSFDTQHHRHHQLPSSSFSSFGALAAGHLHPFRSPPRQPLAPLPAIQTRRAHEIDDEPETTESALADILSGQVRPQYRSSSLVSPRHYDNAALPSSPPTASRSYFSPPPAAAHQPAPPALRPRSQSSTSVPLDPQLRQQMSNQLNGVYSRADQYGYRPAHEQNQQHPSSLPASSIPIRIGRDDSSTTLGGGNNAFGAGGSNNEVATSSHPTRPRIAQFAPQSYSGAGFDSHGWRNSGAELGNGVRHASFTSSVGGGGGGGAWADSDHQREGRARIREDGFNRPWADSDWSQQSGIGFSNMSPFTRDGGRTLNEPPSGFGDGASLYKARRDYSLGAVGSGRKRSDSEWGRDRTLKEAEDEEDDSAFAPPTRSGATSRRHSFAAFNPMSRSQIGFHLPEEDRDKASTGGSTTFPSGGMGSTALSGRMGSSAIDDDDLAADLNSLQLNLEAHAATQNEESRRGVTFVGSMPTHFSSHHAIPSSGSKALADEDADDLGPPPPSDQKTVSAALLMPTSSMPMLSPPIGSSRFFQPSPSPATTSVTPSVAQRSTSRFEFGNMPPSSGPMQAATMSDFGLGAFGPAHGQTYVGQSGPRSQPSGVFGQPAPNDHRFGGGQPPQYQGSPFAGALPPPPLPHGGPAQLGGGFSPFPPNAGHMAQPQYVPPGPGANIGPRPPSSASSAGPGGMSNEFVNLGRGVPLHSVPANAPLYIVEFKAGRKDLFYVDDPTLQLKQGDLVIVEADRGRDVGKFFKPCSLDEVQAFQQRLVEMALGQLATAGQGGQGAPPPPNAAALARMTKEFQPKKLYGKASPADTQMLLSKAQDEVKALALIRSKVAQKNLPMEVCDAEWQWDRRKLTFYYTADQRVDFRELVRELFRVYKTRHGIRRARPNVDQSTANSLELERKRRDKDQAKANELIKLTEELQERSRAKDYSRETLALSARVLLINPEYQTGWSIRRRILLDAVLPSISDENDKVALLEQDVQLTNQALQYNPKNYSVWEHRKWCLQQMGTNANWKFELKMVEAYLEKDGRNFHSWDYRRYLVATLASLPPIEGVPTSSTESELAFTTRKISANFSNFSAWHYRTKLLAKLWQENGWDESNPDRTAQTESEFDLVKQALWSDPNDQSAWLYHRWLVGKGSVTIVRREIQGIQELLEEEPDSRLCLDALVYFKRLLVTLLGTDDSTLAEREQLNSDCLEMLIKLERIDPLRQARYKDLAVHILPARR
ncbi:hypothetical protein OIV83_002244 [Microbotryomycetes sp. JL201]|nr:hypothetical protein OIV83_002244 [Microbotryomycetes sp. JL201]